MSDVIDLAVLKAIPLAEVVEALGFVPRDPGRIQWVCGDRMIEISGQSYMEPAKGAIGQGAVDLASRLTGQDGHEVLPWLQKVLTGVHGQIPSRSAGDVRPKTLRLPPSDEARLPLMHQYLVKVLGIADNLVRALTKVGRLYSDDQGRAVALMRNFDQLAVGAEVIRVQPDGSTSIQFAHGSRRSEGTFFINGTDPNARIVLVESALEALAYVSLKPRDSAISMGGAFNHDLVDRLGEHLVDRGAPVFAGHGTGPISMMAANPLRARFGWAHLTPSTFNPRAQSWLGLLQLQRESRSNEECAS